MATKKAQAKNPETAPQTLWQLAFSCPAEVLSNPALPFLAVEDPAVYAQIVATANRQAQRQTKAAAVKTAKSEIRRIEGELAAVRAQLAAL